MPPKLSKTGWVRHPVLVSKMAKTSHKRDGFFVMHSVKNSTGYMFCPGQGMSSARRPSHTPPSSLCRHHHLSLGHPWPPCRPPCMPSGNIRQIFLMPPPLSIASKIQSKMSVGQFGHAHTSLTHPIHTHPASQMWPNSGGLIVFLGSTLDPTTTHSFSLLFSPSRYCALLLATVLFYLLLCSPARYCALLATVLCFSLLCSPRYCSLRLTTVLSFSLLCSATCYCALLLATCSLLCSASRYLLATVLCFSLLCSASHYCALLATVLSFSLLCSPCCQPMYPAFISVVFGSKF